MNIRKVSIREGISLAKENNRPHISGGKGMPLDSMNPMNKPDTAGDTIDIGIFAME